LPEEQVDLAYNSKQRPQDGVGMVAKLYRSCLLQERNKVSAADMQFCFDVIHGMLNPVTKGGVFHYTAIRRISAGPRAASLAAGSSFALPESG